jgi:hypothetical protein
LKFREVCEFSGRGDEVWARASDLEAVPIYWHGTREFVVARSEVRISADIKFAFGGRGKAEVVVNEENRTVTINYLRGPFKGRQTIAVGNHAVEAVWDVSFNGAFKLLGRWNESHFRAGTKNALRRLCSGSASV